MSKKKAAAQLKIEQVPKYYKDIIALMPGHVFWKDKNGVFLGCNFQQAKDAGFNSPDEMIGKTDEEMPWGIQAEYLREIDQGIMDSKKAQVLEEVCELPDGTKRMFISHKMPLFDENNEVTGILGVSIDITEQKRIEHALLEAEHKAEGMTLVAASIAHELRTPLTSLGVGLNNIKGLLALEGEGIQENKPLDETSLNLLKKVLNGMEREIKSSSLTIDLLLQNLKPQVPKSSEEYFSIVHCVDEALARYPFKPGQRELIEWKPLSDFWIKGSELLMIHVFFNLLKNAFYYIAKAGKGGVQLWIENKASNSILYFKDTGSGIAPDVLPQIFDQFFSRTHAGTGVGLTQCKRVMESLGGEITCESAEGEYTLFKLSFLKAMVNGEVTS